MKNTSLRLAILLIPLLISLSCKEPEEILPEERFLKVYDDPEFQASYIPVDLIQTTDGGYLVLAGTRRETSDFLGTVVIKTDEKGEFVGKIEFPETDVHPIDRWFEQNGNYSFICMDEGSLGARMHSISESLNYTEPHNLNATYPMYVSAETGEIILLSYNQVSQNTILSVLDASGNTLLDQSFSIGAGEGIEEPVIDHFTRTGKQFPFKAGKTSDGMYFFNGFYNYTFSLVFTDLSSTTPQGVVQGQRDEGGISSILPLSSNSFSLSRFNFGDNYVTNNVTLNKNETSSITDLPGESMLEWIPDAPADVLQITVNQQEVILFGSTTKNGQIIIIAYDADSGEWLGSDYLGFSTPYQFETFRPAVDGGLAILGSNAVAGRFNRICLYKLPVQDLEKLISQVSQ